MPQKTTLHPWTVHHRMTDCVTFEGRHGQENLFLQNLDGYFACQNPDDARLIAAAPDLLKALMGVLKRCEGMGYVGVDGQYLKVVRAAIAKAIE